jgi:hypothetical protein
MGQPYWTALLDSLIRQPYWTAVLDSLIGQPYWTALLEDLIEQPYWTTLFHRRDLILYLHMNLFQLTRVSHNSDFSRKENARYAGKKCT